MGNEVTYESDLFSIPSGFSEACSIRSDYELHTEPANKACTWFGEICFCSSLAMLHCLPGSCLAVFCIPYLRPL